MYLRTIAASVCLTAGALLSVPISAHAITLSTSPGLTSTQGTTINDFDTAPSSIATYEGGIIRNSTQSAGGYAPAGDATNFLVTGAFYSTTGERTNTDPISITFNTPGSYFGMYVGGINPSNIVEFFNGESSLGTFNGSEIGNEGDSVYANFNVEGDEAFTRVVLTQLDPGAGFETDNHAFTAVAAVPFELSPALGSLALVAWGVGIGLQRKLKTNPELLSRIMVK